MAKTKKSLQYSSEQASINDLIVFSLYSVVSKGEECDFERLIKECFSLFPGDFGFYKYPQWPDSRKLDRPLRLLREHKLIKGEPGTFFSLTKEGKVLAEDLAKVFKQKRLFK